uniref:CASPASE_P20 domain-containing protein n=1 Tax=Caenorhabditis tropicalis TaxID=1561998 RepID=A0A1I7UB07_9PELO
MFLEECKAHFGTECLYELLQVKKDCDEKELKKVIIVNQCAGIRINRISMKKKEKPHYQIPNSQQSVSDLGDSDLVALIQNRNKERSSFLDSLEAKYAPSSSKKAKRQ